MAFITPKTNWSSVDGVRDTDMNRIEGNIVHLYDNKTELSDFNNLREAFDNAMYDINNRLLIQDLPIGAEFGMHENGILVPFIKLLDNYEGSGRILVVRKDCLYISTLLSGSDNIYEGCFIDTWVNGTYGGGYPAMLSTAAQAALVAVAIKSQGNFSISTISRKAFLLSMHEMQLVSGDGIPIEGSNIPYFNTNARRVSRLSGSPINYWTRSINSTTGNACYISAGGTYAIADANVSELGIRPAFTLPNTFEVTTGIPNTTNVMATAEVI